MTDISFLFSGLGTLVAGGFVGFMRGRYWTWRNLFYRHKSGIITFHPSLPIAKVEKEIAKAKHRVAVIQTWMSNQVNIRPALVQAVTNGAIAQILFIDPESVMLEYRANEFETPTPYDEAKARVRTNLRELKAACDQAGISRSVEIRLYAGTPVMSFYRADDVMYIGVFWRGGSALNGPQIEARPGGYYEEHAERAFNLIWADPSTRVYVG